MKTEYKLVMTDPEFQTEDDLDFRVTKLLSEGWELYGDPIVSSVPHNGVAMITYGQAMTRKR